MAARYEFGTVWRVTGSVGEVRDVLADGASLPRWWPAVYLAVDVRTPSPPPATSSAPAAGRSGRTLPRSSSPTPPPATFRRLTHGQGPPRQGD